MKRWRWMALFAVVLFLLPIGCAPKGERVTTYYDDAGRPTRTVKEDVNVGKYAEYGRTVAALAGRIEDGKRESIEALLRAAQPVAGESAELTAYKQGQVGAMIYTLAGADPREAIAVLQYGKDEYDVQERVVSVTGDTLKFLAGVAALWKTMDTAIENAGDVRVGDGSSYNPVELHGTGEGNIVTLDQSATEVFEPEMFAPKPLDETYILMQ